jgi:PTH2 family peptidyl-tRNA hydrolase
MVKQVICVRTDLRNSQGQKIRTGKIAAQVAHASMKVFFDKFSNWCHKQIITSEKETPNIFNKPISSQHTTELSLTDDEYEWVKGVFTKICVSVDSEEQLMSIYNFAVLAKLPCALITDSGATEFNGVPTKTCCAIGPAKAELIDQITGELKLL